MEHVCYFWHALALDERRIKFLPEYAYGGATAKPDDRNASMMGNESNKESISHPDISKSATTLASASGSSMFGFLRLLWPGLLGLFHFLFVLLHFKHPPYEVGKATGVPLMNNDDAVIIGHGPPGNTPPTKNEDLVNHLQVKKNIMECPHTKEVWFAGTHSDM
jgi:hypothetical protein